MCCDLCDYYFKCEEMAQQNVLCCGKCEEVTDCHGDQIAGRMVDDEDDDVFDLDDEDDYTETEDFEDDYDFEDDDDDFEEDYLNREYNAIAQ